MYLCAGISLLRAESRSAFSCTYPRCFPARNPPARLLTGGRDAHGRSPTPRRFGDVEAAGRIAQVTAAARTRKDRDDANTRHLMTVRTSMARWPILTRWRDTVARATAARGRSHTAVSHLCQALRVNATTTSQQRPDGSLPVDCKAPSCIWLTIRALTVARQAPPINAYAYSSPSLPSTCGHRLDLQQAAPVI